ncbi:MAG: extracellular solute-binding protein [Turicibacter sp.]|nr:extracellular solute-binding protein [Turicibacter sp.]
MKFTTIKKLGLAVAAFGLTTVLGACGNEAEAENTQASQNEITAPEETTANDSRSLVIYSNALNDARSAWLEDIARDAGFELSLLAIGGGDLPNRLITERNNPIADVVFGLNHVAFETLKANDVLSPFTPVWADEIPNGWNDPEGYYHALTQLAITLVYNKAVLDETTAPTDWTDLWEREEFRGQYFINNNLGGATIRMAMASILVRYRDDNGIYGVSEEGWNAMRSFFEHGIVGSQDEFFQSLVDEVTPIVTLWTGGIIQREEEFGVNVGIVTPEIGAPFIIESISIVNGTQNRELAEEFINWFGSAEIQTKWSQEFYQVPANSIARPNAPEAMERLLDGVFPQDIDWEFVTENIDNWMTKIELDIMP